VAVGGIDGGFDLKKLGDVVGVLIVREVGGAVVLIIENIDMVGTRVGKTLVIGTGALENADQPIGIIVGGENGVNEGIAVGLVVGLTVGLVVGLTLGLTVGLIVGLVVGLAVGITLGLRVDETEGFLVYLIVGSIVGL
jgi:hypothetical protein